MLYPTIVLGVTVETGTLFAVREFDHMIASDVLFAVREFGHAIAFGRGLRSKRLVCRVGQCHIYIQSTYDITSKDTWKYTQQYKVTYGSG